eukprot:TRINITY_DN7140_c0_g1_i1.p1 TRINITY_DN7140_c0_g1~~TRINITY_DN7140_c0_g1_i1.p1  ORF type:complete len:340 (+),score=62.28 TRINITY_DN7140_c0_g1_i1:42-1061(+)
MAEIDTQKKLQWKLLNSTGPKPREGHIVVAVNNTIFIFGGSQESESTEPIQINDLWAYTIEGNHWNKILTTGSVPSPRTGSTASVVGKNIYLFGGLVIEKGWVNELYVLDTESMVWTKPDIEGNGPSGRDKSSSVAINSKVYIFGGFGSAIPQITGDAFTLLSTTEFVWFNDIYILNTDSMKWETPNITGQIPSGRCATGMAAIGNEIFVFGGRDKAERINDLYKITISESSLCFDPVKSLGNTPEKRSFHTCVSFQDKLIVFGGLSNFGSHFNDIHIFNSKTNTWETVLVEGTIEPRGFHGTVVVNNIMYVFGGSSHWDPTIRGCTKYHNTLYGLQLL